jgi:hypothetical protein
VFGGVTFGGTNLVFSGTGGTAGKNYFVLASTNLALPLASWTAIGTNSFDAAGNFSFTNPADPDALQMFYLLKLQ